MASSMAVPTFGAVEPGGEMNQQEELQGVMASLHRGGASLGQDAHQFAALKREVQALRMRAASDPDARERLRRLDEMMKNGGYQLQARITQSAARLESCFKQLAAQIEDLAPPQARLAQAADAEAPRAVSKKRNRTFI